MKNCHKLQLKAKYIYYLTISKGQEFGTAWFNSLLSVLQKLAEEVLK